MRKKKSLLKFNFFNYFWIETNTWKKVILGENRGGQFDRNLHSISWRYSKYKNRLAITGGVIFVPVNKLTNELQEGYFTPFNDINYYTKIVCEFLYLIGISFSLFNFN